MSALIVLPNDEDWFMNSSSFKDLMECCLKSCPAELDDIFDGAIANNGLLLPRLEPSIRALTVSSLVNAIPVVHNKWENYIKDEPLLKRQLEFDVAQTCQLKELLHSQG